MVARYGDQYVGVLDGTQKPPLMADGRRINAGVSVISQVVTLAAQASGDTILIARRPAGSVLLGIELIATATLGGTATIAIGTAVAPEKYRSAATFTAADTPTRVMKGAAADDPPSTAEEDIIITVGAAALPSSGSLVANTTYASAMR